MRFATTQSSTAIRPGGIELILAAGAGALVFAAILTFGMTALIAAVLIGALLLVAIARPDAATLVVLFVIYSDAAAVAVRSHGVPSTFAISFFLLLAIPMAKYVVLGKQSIRTDLVLGLMVAYVGAMLASVFFSRYAGETTDTVTKYLFEGLLLYFLIINSVRSPEVLRKALWMILLAGSLLASITLIQDFTHTYNNEYGGFALTKIVNANGYLDEANTDTGEKDSSGRDIGRPRATGPIGDPNFYGQILCVVVPVSVILAFSHPQRIVRILALASCLALVGAVLLTFSRGAAIALGVLTVVLVFLRYLKLTHVAIAVALIVLAISLNPAYSNRLNTISLLQSRGMRSADYSVQERATILLASVHVFLDHPLFGVGPGQSGKFIASYGNAEGFTKIRKGMEAHNTYLQQLDETGLVGFVCLGAIVLVTLRNLLRIRKRWRVERPEYAHVATALMLGIGMFLTTSLFLHLAFMRYFSLLLGLAGSAALIYREEAGEFDRLADSTTSLSGRLP